MIIKDWIPHTVGTSRSHTMVWICPRNEQFLEVRWWKLSQNGLHKAYSTSTFQEYIGAYSWNVEIEYDLFKPFIPCLDEYPTLLGRVGTILVEEIWTRFAIFERQELHLLVPIVCFFFCNSVIIWRINSLKLALDFEQNVQRGAHGQGRQVYKINYILPILGRFLLFGHYFQ